MLLRYATRLRTKIGGNSKIVHEKGQVFIMRLESNSFRDCESINNFKKIFLVLCNNLQIRHCQMQQSSNPSLSDATIFKPVILAWMPESSAKDGNYMIINNYCTVYYFKTLATLSL